MKHLLKHWFLYLLLIVIPLGVLIGQMSPQLSHLITSTVKTQWVVFAVLFCMSVTLRLDQLTQTAARPWGIITAIAINAILFPLIVWGIVLLLPASPFSAGLLIMAAVPSTLASAAVWARKAGGNDGLCLIVTLISNGLCFLVTPFWLWVTLGKSAPLDSQALAIRLMFIAMLPMLLGQVARLSGTIKQFADSNRPKISMAAQAGILSIVFIGAIRSGPELLGTGSGFSFGSLVIVWLICLGIHLLLLVISWFSALMIRCSREDAIAVMFSGSQKTLPIAIDLATAPILLSSGISSLVIIPPLLYHATQLIVDTLVVEYLEKSKR